MADFLEATVGSRGDPYADGTPNLEITVPAGRAVGQSFVGPEATPVTVRVAGRHYAGHVLANKPEYEVVWFSPTLFATGGERTTLGRVLTDAGFRATDRVHLHVAGAVVEVHAATGSR